METDDFGQTWDTLFYRPHCAFNNLLFLDKLTGIGVLQLVDSPSVLVMTTNAGRDFREILVGPKYFLHGVESLDSLRWWVVGGQGEDPYNTTAIVLNTTNGGVSWRRFSIEGSPALHCVVFVSGTHGIVAGGGGIWRTTDAGSSWHQTFENSNATLVDLAFVDTSTGWCVGRIGDNGGIILRSDDSGESWVRQDALGATMVTGIKPITRELAWATGIVGRGGIILRTMTGGVVGVDDQISRGEEPRTSRLQHCFPNPSNGSITVQFYIAHPALAVLSVSDILGQQVAVLAQDRFEPGTHRRTVVLDLPSGFYLLLLRAGPFVDTTKLLLLR